MFYNWLEIVTERTVTEKFHEIAVFYIKPSNNFLSCILRYWEYTFDKRLVRLAQFETIKKFLFYLFIIIIVCSIYFRCALTLNACFVKLY